MGNIESRQLSPDGYWRWSGYAWEPVTSTAARVKTNRLAIAAFVSSVACIPYVWPLNSIAGVVLGIVALTQLRERPYERGSGLAVAGLLIGGIVLVLVGAMAALLFFFGYECRHGC